MVKKKKGFTIVELVIVIAVIAVLAAVLIPTFATMISKANKSADLQLVTNMNYAIADGRIDPDFDTPDNIRKMLRDNGIKNFSLKEDDAVIVYNSTDKMFEIYKVDDLIAAEAEQEIMPLSWTVPASTGLPYYAEQIFDGLTIISVSGDPLAEALYNLHNLSGDVSAIESQMSAALELIDAKYNSISYNIQRVLSQTLFVNDEGKLYSLGISGTSAELTEISTDNPISNQTRVIFSENLIDPYVPIDPFLVVGTGLHVIVPNNVTLYLGDAGREIVKNNENWYFDIPMFGGNISKGLIPSSKILPVEKIKENVKQDNTEIANKDQFYVVEYDIAEDGQILGGPYIDLQKAINEAQAKYNMMRGTEPDYEAKVILNGDVTISSGNITIPKGVVLEIPYGLGNSEFKDLIEQEEIFTNRVLGDAFPAHDVLSGTVAALLDSIGQNSEMYYLCGEGEGVAGGVIAPALEMEPTDTLVDGMTVMDLDSFYASPNITTRNAAYSLTINSGAKLTIQGKVRVGGVIGYNNASGYQGHTSGAYGEIVNNGNIVVDKNATLDVWGFITGNGNVVANNGATVYEPFVVADYLDTFPTMMLYPFVDLTALINNMEIFADITEYNSPFSRFTVMNIQNTFTINYGAELYGRANLWVALGVIKSFLGGSNNTKYDMYARANAPLVSYDSNNAAIQLQNKSYLVCEYNPSKTVSLEKGGTGFDLVETNRGTLVGDIGKTTVTIYGTVHTGGIEMDLLTGFFKNLNGGAHEDLNSVVSIVNTANCILPISYLLDFTVGGDEGSGHLVLDNRTKFAIMPGSVLTVNKGSTLTIKENSELYVLDTMYSTYYLIEDYVDPDSGDLLDALEDEETGEVSKSLKDSGLSLKYYPSALLLQNNGFSASGMFIVNGTLDVKSGASIGGIVQSDEVGATVKVESGADTAGVFSLGGELHDWSQDGFTVSLMDDDVDMSIFTTYYNYPLRVLNIEGEIVTVNAGDTYKIVAENDIIDTQLGRYDFEHKYGSAELQWPGLDFNNDGVYDVWYADLDGDGNWDWYWDSGYGFPDTLFYELDEEGNPVYVFTTISWEKDRIRLNWATAMTYYKDGEFIGFYFSNMNQYYGYPTNDTLWLIDTDKDGYVDTFILAEVVDDNTEIDGADLVLELNWKTYVFYYEKNAYAIAGAKQSYYDINGTQYWYFEKDEQELEYAGWYIKLEDEEEYKPYHIDMNDDGVLDCQYYYVSDWTYWYLKVEVDDMKAGWYYSVEGEIVPWYVDNDGDGVLDYLFVKTDFNSLPVEFDCTYDYENKQWTINLHDENDMLKGIFKEQFSLEIEDSMTFEVFKNILTGLGENLEGINSPVELFFEQPHNTFDPVDGMFIAFTETIAVNTTISGGWTKA